jgi:hypothetical protein
VDLSFRIYRAVSKWNLGEVAPKRLFPREDDLSAVGSVFPVKRRSESGFANRNTRA